MSAVSSRRPARGPRGVGRGLFVDNGFVADHQRLRRLAVEPRFVDRTERTTDSELLFFLALTFGLDEDPPPALGGLSCGCVALVCCSRSR